MRFLARRLIALCFVLVGITLLMFVISHIVPADPAVAAAGPNATKEQVQILHRELGLDRPLPVQYGQYLGGLVRGDFGRSTQTQHPVRQDIGRYFPATVELTFFTMVLYTIIGVPLGVLAALRRGWIDRFTNVFAIFGVAIPSFWLALVLQVIFFSKLGWLPSGSRLDQGMSPPQAITHLYLIDSLLTANWAVLGSCLRHMILPATTLALGRLGVVMRVSRVSVRETMMKDFIRTARAKGLSRGTVLTRHVMRNSMIPIVTMLGLQAGWLLNGVVVVEIIFGWPGVGLYAVNAISAADFPAVMGVTLVVAFFFVVINFVVDLSYRLFDPRVTL